MARELKGEKLEKELLRLEEMKAYEKEKENTQKSGRSDLAVDHAADHRIAGPV